MLRSTIEHVLALSRERYQDPTLSLKTVSRILNISSEHLGRLFLKHVGSTFRPYLRDFRMQKAMELLTCSTHEVKIVSVMVGYRSHSHFGQDFREWKGMSPGKVHGHATNFKFHFTTTNNNPPRETLTPCDKSSVSASHLPPSPRC